MSKSETLAQIQAAKVIALLRTSSDADAVPEACRALQTGGVNCIELTLTTPGAYDLCAEVSRSLPGVLLGMGTVLDAEQAKRSLASGAKFLVTPAVIPEVVSVCVEANVPVFGGALTPTEVYQSWKLGVDVVKIFPAEFFGPAYLRSLKAPFPQIKLMPTGGVTPETVGDFLAQGAFATAAGSSLVTVAMLKSRNWTALTERAKAFATAAETVTAGTAMNR